MNYRPKVDNLILWDTWMFANPDGRKMHLFFLANRPECWWEWVGHAVSEDLTHWQEMPDIQVRCPGDDYDVELIGTGMVFESPDGGFLMSYTANLNSPRQRIAFLHSQDLTKWEKLWFEPCIAAEAPYYETDGTKCICANPAFRDAYIHCVGDHFEALIGAHSSQGPTLLRGCIARYRSRDNQFKEWDPLPPLIGPGVTALMEVPEHFEMGGRHYVLWSTSAGLGVACDTSTRRGCAGTFYAMSDSYDGPYIVSDDNLLIGAGGIMQSYVGRTIKWQGERLLYHHMIHPYPSLAFPKRVLQRENGALQLGYWSGIESVHIDTIALSLDGLEVQGENLGVGEWTSSGPGNLVGFIDGGGSMALAVGEYDDVHIRCKVTPECARFGVVLRDPGQYEDRDNGVRSTEIGIALQGDIEHGEWHFGKPAHSWCSYICPIEIVSEALAAGQTYQLDLIVRDIYFEAYVDGIWKFTQIINSHARKGKIGFYVEDGSATFEGICAWALEPMTQPFPEE